MILSSTGPLLRLSKPKTLKKWRKTKKERSRGWAFDSMPTETSINHALQIARLPDSAEDPSIAMKSKKASYSSELQNTFLCEAKTAVRERRQITLLLQNQGLVGLKSPLRSSIMPHLFAIKARQGKKKRGSSNKRLKRLNKKRKSHLKLFLPK